MIRLFFNSLVNGWAKLWSIHWLAFFLMVGLGVTGVLFVYSATHTSEQSFLQEAARQQVIWMGMGLIAFLFMTVVDYRVWVKGGLGLLAIAIGLLVLTLVVGKVVNGAKSWLVLTSSIRLQPAELTKLAYICALAQVILWLRPKIKTFWALLVIGVVGFVPFALIMKQPDLGSGLVFGPITLFALFIAGARKRYLLIPILAIALVAVGSYVWVHKMEKDVPGLKPYQLDRIRVFFDPNRDPRGAGWTITQSLIAIGSGGLEGKGYTKGDQNIFGFLPKNIAYNDFIFSIIGEEVGFIGGGAIILAEALLMLCMAHIALRAGDLSGMVLAAGVIGMFITHFFVNIGMTIQVVPITGIPLPFISYGGTFVLVCMSAMGLLQSIWIHREDVIEGKNL